MEPQTRRKAFSGFSTTTEFLVRPLDQVELLQPVVNEPAESDDRQGRKDSDDQLHNFNRVSTCSLPSLNLRLPEAVVRRDCLCVIGFGLRSHRLLTSVKAELTLYQRSWLRC
jgi:hypothetical protein